MVNTFVEAGRTRLTAALCLTVLALGTSFLDADGQIREWTWKSGSSNVTQPGVYGALGTPAAENVPGARGGASSWTDSNGNFWLFGGSGYDSTGIQGYLNDLWAFSPFTSEWTWIGGSSTVPNFGEGQPGVYGTLGVPAAGNVPGGRSYASSWTDSNGNFWFFGGQGYGSNAECQCEGWLNDLWEFNPSTRQWGWMSGNPSLDSGYSPQPGVYGTLGTPAAGNVPGGRQGAAGWTDRSGNLWLFGGEGYDSTGATGFLNDLWEFNPSTGEWTWMGGSSTVGSSGGQPGVYGTLGTPAAENIPGGRESASSWTDSSGNFWLFGGEGYDSTGTGGLLNDLWEYISAAEIGTAPLASVSTLELTFAAILVETTSGSQSVELSNTGKSALTVTGITASGDFAETNNCGSSVAAGGSCTINVTFTPSGGGVQSGTLTITDNNNNVVGSSQAVALSGTGQDFTLVTSAGATVSPGEAASYGVTLISQGGFSGAVRVMCSEPSGLNGSSCTCEPNSVTLNSSSDPVVVVGVSTSASSMAPAVRRTPPANPGRPLAVSLLWLALATTLMLLLVRTRFRRRWAWAALALVVLSVLMWASCGTGGSGSSSGSQGNPGTTAGIYSLTVSATSGSITHTATLSLTVQ